MFDCYRKEMAVNQEEIHNILVAVLSGDEKEIYKALNKKKEIDDKSPNLRTVDEKNMLKSLSNKIRKFPKHLIDGIQKKFPRLQRTPICCLLSVCNIFTTRRLMSIYKVYSIGRTWSWPVMSAPACCYNYLLCIDLKHSQHSVSLFYYYSLTIFSKYSPQTSQIQFLEEASTGLFVGAIP